MDKGRCTILNSEELWAQARQLFAGGVNSPVRAAVKPFPFYVERGKGAYIYTVEGNKFIDYVLGYGPLILGHSPESVKRKIIEQLEKGWLFGTPSKLEIELAKKISSHIPSAQKIRFVNSGTEATMAAIRLARGYSKRSKILKFSGNYHGAHDYTLVEAGSAATEYNVTTSDGIPMEIMKTVEICEFNDLDCVDKKLRNEDIAAALLEPIMGNAGVILPEKGFLSGLRELTKSYNSLLIFDEVITGFRIDIGGAQSYYQIYPDITTLGKIIGGGFPIGAVAGKAEIIDNFTPAGRVFNAGTFNANPISMIAGIATIEELEKEYPYNIANKASKTLVEELERLLKIKHTINHIGSMFQVFFGIDKVRNYSDAKRANKEYYIKFHERLLKERVFIPPSQYETIFTSAAHEDDVVNDTIDKLAKVIGELS
ncbi:glutamate-1-semialdehyde-2,1-aminomutase [Sulfolobus islandicus Y.G.57.14]|jgi:glutamate-1-semialdehyde 2,1-aminomutase|uniref:Glutamate-1-semialdehyde 2,1-aminomutase n=5 Tax=Saccharolobus islandicus TaxID=43080 RepID=GSA_SACI1|nr:glutamate-1-semialdehyde 2,1-aminomutase [Sulfolobus islandicus]C3MJ22.1 RecName: Full=Glutamate-1-semialdehyde 2,1-aminomutase; Short=GSA; AltName: Full=Glutamate-1-semialdehyde aminotransferase; Short=GSA-AT [Sulfolobus islandicus L.S.2.15]C3N842.1 RecName: Full=Glutamate-1-semialdehyde 2,1-aminomutase; Short=GSA; AltName: Full=Glutamate-1-semialdehyde aminotransferase; Short=GSA-AT [Sulfolobus islandicus Y.G.57.14]C3NF69.1 RecName: Full=Glutamate-1-semialdehyde 2,1-aminomutase; Short=GSA; 